MADTAAVAPAAAAPETAAPRVKKLALRLDDGTLIRCNGAPTEAEVLKPAEAWEAGLLTEDHLLRMQALLCEVHAKLPEEGPLKSISMGSKRSMDSVLEVGQTVSKKSRSTGPLQANGAPFEAMPPAVANGAPGTEFVAICHHILNYLTTKVLAPHQANIFKGPVDPGAYPDYHQIITNPMWFDKIVDRLNSGYYKGPEGFYEDMLALLDNCYTFNVEKYRSEVGTWGITMEIAFLKAWAKTPFAATVPPRNPRPLPNPTHVIPPKRPGAAPRAPRARPLGAARGRPGRPAGSFARTKSVNSYGAVQQPTMTQEMTAALVNALNNPEILNANLQTVVEILRQADELGEDEDGEATLDLEKITPPTAMKLYNLVVARRGVPASGGYRMEEDDDDYDPEEEDD